VPEEVTPSGRKGGGKEALLEKKEEGGKGPESSRAEKSGQTEGPGSETPVRQQELGVKRRV